MLLKNNSNLVHLVRSRLGMDFYLLLRILYKIYYADWKKMDAIHLLTRHHNFGRTLNETTIERFNFTYGEMCRDVLTRIQPYLE